MSEGGENKQALNDEQCAEELRRPVKWLITQNLLSMRKRIKFLRATYRMLRAWVDEFLTDSEKKGYGAVLKRCLNRTPHIKLGPAVYSTCTYTVSAVGGDTRGPGCPHHVFCD
jgi:hypothetical protein